MTNTPSGTLEAVAGRLQKAMAYSQKTITELQAALDRAGVEGSKYSNVQRYVRGKGGKSPPSFDWLEGAAKALGVEVVWLAFGMGSMTWGQTATDEERAALSEGLELLLIEHGDSSLKGTKSKNRKQAEKRG